MLIRQRTLLIALAVVACVATLRLAVAAPSQQAAPTCAWERLSSGGRASQNAMVRVPGVGALTFGGVDLGNKTVSSDVRRFDRAANSWQVLAVGGSGPGKRSEPAAVLRGLASNPEFVTYGGVDSLPKGGGTFTWQSPLLGAGAAGQGPLDALAANSVQDSTHRLVADAAAPSWQGIGAAGQAPRTDHSAVWDPVADAMIVFGGRTDEDAQSVTDELKRLTLGDSSAWQALTPAGRRPSKRFGHSAVFDGAASRMVVFGGTSDWKKGLDDVWVLELGGGWDKAVWKELKPTGTGPSGRFDHAAAYLPGIGWMIVFGGSPDGSRELSDIYALDLVATAPKWIKLNPTGQKPPALMGLAAIGLDDGTSALLQGGQNGEDAASQTYRLACTAGAVPTATTGPITNTPVPMDTSTVVPSTDTPTPVPTTHASETPEPPTVTVPPSETPTTAPSATATTAPRPMIYLPRLAKNDA
ncbi:MAG: hypothetical protein ACH37Z_17100 [Anaerolineae bacterium]